jgi:hypothetical protein
VPSRTTRLRRRDSAAGAETVRRLIFVSSWLPSDMSEAQVSKKMGPSAGISRGFSGGGKNEVYPVTVTITSRGSSARDGPVAQAEERQAD